MESNTDTPLSPAVVDTVLSNRDLGHAIMDAAFSLKEVNKRVNGAVDRFKVGTGSIVTGRAAFQSKMRSLLSGEDHDPATVYYVILSMLGPGIYNWEPDTIWASLDREFGVVLPELEQNQLLSLITLIETSSFFYDASVFKNTALALNGLDPSPELIQEMEVGDMVWAVICADLFSELIHYGDMRGKVFPFDFEPLVYMAVTLHRNSFLLAPPPLSIAQSFLDSMNKDGLGLDKSVVESIWKKLQAVPMGKTDDIKFDESSTVSVQLGKLIDLYRHAYHQSLDLVDGLKNILKTLDEV